MEILSIVVSFLIGVFLGAGVMGLVQMRRQNELEEYEKKLKRYREELEREFYYFEFPGHTDEKKDL